MAKKETVVVIGGGVGGLTAAHELIERDFAVDVYERRLDVGGKAASTRDGRNYPREHGFRFFPSWYRHLPDTLARIPYRSGSSHRDARWVSDNLIGIENELLTWYDREPVRLLTHFPRSITQAKTAASFLKQFASLGLSAEEVSFFAQKMVEFLTMPDPVRAQKLESITWWDYVRADEKSQAYRDLIAATTRLMIAARAEVVSAYSIGRLVLRTFSDALTTIDRILDGPTKETWMDPWEEYLRGCGTNFHMGWELESIVFREPGGTVAAESTAAISHVVFTRVAMSNVSRLLQLLPILSTSLAPAQGLPAIQTPPSRPKAEKQSDLRSCRSLVAAILADPDWKAHASRTARSVDDEFDEANAALKILDSAFGAPVDCGAHDEPNFDAGAFYDRLQEHYLGVLRPLDAVAASLRRLELSPFAEPKEVKADYFVFALPVEQMAYYVNRSAAMRTHDPSLASIVPLSLNGAWMSGIQFYLRQPCDLVEGHIVCMDSEWSLTAIEQTQFWRDIDLDVKDAAGQKAGTLRSVVSVDVSTWDQPGRFIQLEAFNCTKSDIAREVWNELKGSVSRMTKTARLRDDMLFDGPPLRAGVNYNVDDNLADLFDRKKQAEFERARAVEVEVAAATQRELPYIWGASRDVNAEPLLLNRVNTLALRPNASTAIPNMFIAADYVRTETDLACMEGANEAGRRAVNALLQASGSRHDPCRLWPFSLTRDLLERFTQMQRMGSAWDAASRAAGAVGRAADVVFGAAGQAAATFRNKRNDS